MNQRQKDLVWSVVLTTAFFIPWLYYAMAVGSIGLFAGIAFAYLVFLTVRLIVLRRKFEKASASPDEPVDAA